MNIFTKQNQTHRHKKTKGDKVGVGLNIFILLHNIDNQQGPSV